jgi:hypothetical protein
VVQRLGRSVSSKLGREIAGRRLGFVASSEPHITAVT